MPRIPAEERYSHHGPAYHRLRSCHDLGSTLLPVLKNIIDLSGLDIVEMGIGTGPITLALLPYVKFIHGYDIMPHMVDTARINLSASGYTNWELAVGDHRRLPHSNSSADLVIAGFTIGPMATTERNGDWKGEVDKAIAEMNRVIRPAGMAMILEGIWAWEEPSDGKIEHPWFRALTKYLEQSYGFQVVKYRNDKDYSPLKETPEDIEMIFGEVGVERLKGQDWIMPECEGLWWKQAPL